MTAIIKRPKILLLLTSALGNLFDLVSHLITGVPQHTNFPLQAIRVLHLKRAGFKLKLNLPAVIEIMIASPRLPAAC